MGMREKVSLYLKLLPGYGTQAWTALTRTDEKGQLACRALQSWCPAPVAQCLGMQRAFFKHFPAHTDDQISAF